MEIRRGTIRGFDSTTYKATVQVEGNAIYLVGVPVNRGLAASAILSGRSCAVLFFDANHAEDAMVLGVY